ncbi:MAG: glycosyltransferase, partial [Marinirhabdus sp.]
GQGSKSDTIRGVMRALGTSIITYTRQQATELKGAMPKKTITAAPNALFSREQMQSGTSPMQPKNLIYVGRLTEAKKPMFLLRAFAKSLGDIPKGTQLVFVGEGPEMKKLQGFIEQNDLSARVKLKGHISAHKKLGQLYSESLLSVSPGYVGLSVTQSFGFGVPMLVSKTENHSPEIEAVREGENALFFETGSIEDFKEKLLQFYNNKPYWVSQRGQIVAFCKENYSVEAMAKVFANLM